VVVAVSVVAPQEADLAVVVLAAALAAVALAAVEAVVTGSDEMLAKTRSRKGF
jgi:hypothetical protein